MYNDVWGCAEILPEHVLYVFVGTVDDLIKDPTIRLAVNVNGNVSYNEKKIQKYIQNIAADFTK